ncbi:hypothetical protein [Clostridium sp.]
MAMSILKLKVAYNVLILREKKAEKFLEDTNYSQVKRESWIPEFVKITECLSMLMIKHKEITGKEMLDSEVLDGFQ